MLGADRAVAQKPGGIFKVYPRDSPASMSILEEGTNSTKIPMMGCSTTLSCTINTLHKTVCRAFPEEECRPEPNKAGNESCRPTRKSPQWARILALLRGPRFIIGMKATMFRYSAKRNPERQMRSGRPWTPAFRGGDGRIGGNSGFSLLLLAVPRCYFGGAVLEKRGLLPLSPASSLFFRCIISDISQPRPRGRSIRARRGAAIGR